MMIKAALPATMLFVGVAGLLGGLSYMTEQSPAYVQGTTTTVRKYAKAKPVAHEMAASVIVTEAPAAATPSATPASTPAPPRQPVHVAQPAYLNPSVVRGQAVSTSTRRPLAYARIYAAGNAHNVSGLLAIADREGNFAITLERGMGEVQVLIEHPGYEDHTVTFPVGSSSEQDLGSFYLRPE